MTLSTPLLIIANSGRLLAEVARSIGLWPIVIDCYGDLDTRQYALASYKINSLALVHLLPELELAINKHKVTRFIYGSGFEYYPESLEYLAERLLILGNDPAIFIRQLNKRDFFEQLDELSIPYPTVSFQAPEVAEGWLMKPMQGQGGVGIKPYQPELGVNDAEWNTALYWQKYQSGSQHSVLFLADKGDIEVVGFNTQWCFAQGVSTPFLFSGIMNDMQLPKTVKALITCWLRELIAVFGLKGLNTLDFIWTDERCLVLEINPRPSASLQLYPAAWLARHIQACAGDSVVTEEGSTAWLPTGLKQSGSKCLSGFQLVYANQVLTIPEDFLWPDWCRDLPAAGAIIGTTQPICSIIASDQSAQQLMAKLLGRQQLLLTKLYQGI